MNCTFDSFGEMIKDRFSFGCNYTFNMFDDSQFVKSNPFWLGTQITAYTKEYAL